MPVWAWVALGVFLVLVVPTGLAAIVAGIGLWKRVASIEETVGKPLEMLSVKLEELNARSAAANAKAEEVNRGLTDLNRSLDKLGVLSWALGDARDALGLWRTITRSK